MSALNGWSVSVPPETTEWLPTGGEKGGRFSEFPPPPQQTQQHTPVKSTYIHDLFINLLTLIYDPWLDPVLVSSGYFFLLGLKKKC